MDVTLTIRRYQPDRRDDPYYEDFDLDAAPSDRVVDMEPFFERYRRVRPYLAGDDLPSDREQLQSPGARERFDDTTKCILCAACTSSCPVYWADEDYVGPAAIVQAHRFIFDSRNRDVGKHLEAMDDREGVWRCRTIHNCTRACPRDIRVTKAIAEMKQAILWGRV